MKLITFAVPCYNSAEYMDRCIETLLTGGRRVEIVIIDDGSTDRTPEIADRYAEKYPDIIRVVHQPNGGHGEGVNQGLAYASGRYFKVVDSDDWLDTRALHRLLDYLEHWENHGIQTDLVIANYIYDHLYEDSRHAVRYRSVFPSGKIVTWDEMGLMNPSQYLIMHALIYRTEVLRQSGLRLPKHTFYVDNIVAYQPLPYVRTLCYMDLDLYHYFIGRENQSVNESVMMKRIDQQLKVTKIIMDCVDLESVPSKKLEKYMERFLSIMLAVSSIHLLMIGDREALGKRRAMWRYLKEKDEALYRRMRVSVGGLTFLPGALGDKLSLAGYRAAKKVVKFQ